MVVDCYGRGGEGEVLAGEGKVVPAEHVTVDSGQCTDNRSAVLSVLHSRAKDKTIGAVFVNNISHERTQRRHGLSGMQHSSNFQLRNLAFAGAVVGKPDKSVERIQGQRDDVPTRVDCGIDGGNCSVGNSVNRGLYGGAD